MNALSLDLRTRLLNHALNHSIRHTAQAFHVSPNTVFQLKKLYYETGSITPRPGPTTHAHAVSAEGELYLQVLLAEKVDLTLDQLCAGYEETYGVRVGRTTMHNTLKRLAITRKKTVYDPKRHRAEALDEKLSYISQLEGVAPEDRVYLDEMGATLNMNLEYGRSRQGERVYDENPTAPGATVNTLAVLTEHGVEAIEMHRDSLTAQRFIFYLNIYLIPLLTNGKVLILDNHPVHRSKGVIGFLEDQKIPYIYLPPYSPELNPIEEAFSKAKHYIKRHKPRELGDLAGTIERAMKTITPDDVMGYVIHAEEFLCVTS